MRSELDTTRRELRAMQNLQAAASAAKTSLAVQRDAEHIQELTSRITVLQTQNAKLKQAAQRGADAAPSATARRADAAPMVTIATLTDVSTPADGSADLLGITSARLVARSIYTLLQSFRQSCV